MVMTEGGVEIDAGHIDLTVEELLAASSAAGAVPPPQVVGLEPPDRATIDTAIRVGRRSLLARGLMRNVDGNEQIDQALADSVVTAGAPAVLNVVSTVSVEDRSLTWLYLDEEQVVVLSTLEPGLFRLRLLPAEAYGAALSIVVGLDEVADAGGLPAFSVDLAPMTAAIESLPESQRSVESPEAAAAVQASIDALDPATLQLVSDRGGISTSVVTVVADPAGEASVRLVSWLRSSNDEWSRVEFVDGLISGSPTSSSDLMTAVRAAVGSAPHS